jgi:hypothetical protein
MSVLGRNNLNGWAFNLEPLTVPLQQPHALLAVPLWFKFEGQKLFVSRDDAKRIRDFSGLSPQGFELVAKVDLDAGTVSFRITR